LTAFHHCSKLATTIPASSAGIYRRKDDRVSDAEREAWRNALDHGKHLSPEDLAEREGVPIQTVYGWNKTGAGPRYLRIGRHVRYRVADVLAWEKARLVERRSAVG
jgi:predicted DNA-binding transcriptional regulator AlpA